MAVAESDAAQNSPALPKDLLENIFGLLSSHERRVVIPLVCKSWRAAILPSDSVSALWEDIEIRDDTRLRGAAPSPGAGCAADASNKILQQSEATRTWLSQRRECVKRLTVVLSTSQPTTDGRARATSIPSWARAFGLALPVLTAAKSSKLNHLTLYGPGVNATARYGATAALPPTASPCSRSPEAEAEAAGAVLCGAFSLSSLEELFVYDVPWANALLYGLARTGRGSATSAAAAVTAPPLPPCVTPALDLTHLRRLAISRSFYQSDDGRSPRRASTLLDGGAGEAWAALGAALGSLPCLEHLDMSYTYAMSYCDPARGVAVAPWPALRALRELSLAHDLAVQPPPPPPPPLDSCDKMGAPAGGAAPHDTTDAGLGLDSQNSDTDPDPCTDLGACPGPDAVAEAQLLLLLPEESSGFGPPMLTIEAAHAAVELLSWLPRCAAVTALDLRCCGLEAVPLAVAHLPALARLDLGGNPLVSMRLPGPLGALVWLRLSLDPCYDMVYEMMLAEGGGGAGDAVAVEEEMWSVELPTPQLEELEVDSTSRRALGLIREAAAGLPRLRRLLLEDNSGDALR